jgi:glucose/arabinose dehydrogenase
MNSFSKLSLHLGGALLAAAVLLTAPTTRAAEVTATVSLKMVAQGLTAPIALTSLSDGSGRLLILDQTGTIHTLNKDGTLSDQLFLDVRDRLAKIKQGFDERGLLCVALHPQFRANGKFYISYSAPRRAAAPEGWDHTMHISEFTAAQGDHSKADPASERVLLQIDKPYFNHNCGRMAFGPDGYLYIGVGDGGAGNGTDEEGSKINGHVAKGNSQDLSQLLGKILRIDVNKSEGGKAYAIPSGNPFVKGGGRPEIFAYGVRNCWGISFDRGGTHELFAADVGQSSFEEVNIIVKGANYGWPRREGFVCFDSKNPANPPADCPNVDDDGKPFTPPILAYKNLGRFQKDPEARGSSVTGGYVYRGKAIPALTGKYVFGDWSRNFVVADGVLFAATRPAEGGSKVWALDSLEVSGKKAGRIGAFVWAFGEDEEGELYVLTNSFNGLVGKNGKVWKLVPAM